MSRLKYRVSLAVAAVTRYMFTMHGNFSQWITRGLQVAACRHSVKLRAIPHDSIVLGRNCYNGGDNLRHAR
jgi:hypothetical protein